MISRIVYGAAIVAVLFSGWATSPVNGQSLNLPGPLVFGVRPQAGDPDYLSIGPGKVRLAFTRGGRLLELKPTWNAGQSLISGGGFIAFGSGVDGRLIELVNTSLGDLKVREETRNIPVCYEGMSGGFRAPSPAADDDSDGTTDEDRLDGIDNDGDGKIDEDFAAIGDEMVVTEFSSDALGALFHQECYAWSLPHIDGVVMVSLELENHGVEPLYDLRLGTLLQIRGPFSFSQSVVTTEVSRERAFSVPRWVSSTGDGSLALVALPAHNRPGDWLGGYVPVTEDLGASVRAQIVAGDQDPVRELPGNAGPLRVGSAAGRLDGDANLYALSPPFKVLYPGEVAEVEFALIAVRRGSNIDEAVKNAFKTCWGDGTHTYLPPPVSMTPRVLWGYYQPVGRGDPGMAIELEDTGTPPVNAADIAYFSGVPASHLERDDMPGRELVIRGKTFEKVLRQGERVTLKGRLRSGEFFEAILRPKRLTLDASSLSDLEAQRFWKSSGKLSRELLSGSPNPFRGTTTILYEVPSVIETEAGNRIQSSGAFATSVKVYNVTGRLVTVLVDRNEFPGVHRVNWNAVDDSGNSVASGVYYVRLQIEERFITRRLTLLK